MKIFKIQDGECRHFKNRLSAITQYKQPDRQWRSSSFPFYNSLLLYQWWSVHFATTRSNFSATTKLPISGYLWLWPWAHRGSGATWGRMHDAVVSASLRLKSTYDRLGH